MSSITTDPWQDNLVQFAKLIRTLGELGLFEQGVVELIEEKSDLTYDQVLELQHRALPHGGTSGHLNRRHLPFVDGKLECPKCGNTDPNKFSYLEDILNQRSVAGVEDGVLMIHGFYETGEGLDDGIENFFVCQAGDGNDWCGTEFRIANLEIDFE